MAELRIDLVTPTGMVLENTLLPDDMLTEEVVAELVDELNLPRLSPSGEEVSYNLEIVGQGSQLPRGLTLREAGASSGDRLRLTSSKPLPRQSPSTPRPGPLAETAPLVASAGSVEVVLSVLDVNRSERTSLDSTKPVGTLVRQIAETYQLPARDKLDELISYRIESKALGRFLAHRETLAQAGVPRLDRLTVHREEHAGATSRRTLGSLLSALAGRLGR